MGKRPLGRPRRRWEDNIRMDLKEIDIGFIKCYRCNYRVHRATFPLRRIPGITRHVSCLRVNKSAVWKVSDLTYNLRDIRDKQLFAGNSDRSRCHLYTSLKLFWSRHMAPWTMAAAYECSAAQFMSPWTAMKEASQECGGDTSSCPGRSNGRLSRISYRL